MRASERNGVWRGERRWLARDRQLIAARSLEQRAARGLLHRLGDFEKDRVMLAMNVLEHARLGAKPTTSTYQCRPYAAGSNETCTHTSPAAGQWWIGVRGYTAAD